MKLIISVIGAVAVFLFTSTVFAGTPSPLVDVTWLKSHVCSTAITILDVRRSAEDYRSAHIPCAVHTNYYKDGWRMRKSGIPHMMPPVTQLEALVGRLGIGNDTHVSVYGSGTGPFDAAETTSIYLTLKYLGHDMVSILDGGLPAWMDEWSADFAVGTHEPDPAQFVANARPELLISRSDMQTSLADGTAMIDVRSHDMFMGVNRAWMFTRSGTIPNALNLPMSWLTKNAGLKFRNPKQLERLFSAVGAPTKGRVILFCNAGLESSMGWFAAHELLGMEEAVLYDGSLAEWTKDETLPLTKHVEFE